jgi:hypothetical protein
VSINGLILLRFFFAKAIFSLHSCSPFGFLRMKAAFAGFFRRKAFAAAVKSFSFLRAYGPPGFVVEVQHCGGKGLPILRESKIQCRCRPERALPFQLLSRRLPPASIRNPPMHP